MIEEHMAEKRFGFMKEQDRRFVIGFTQELEALGYTYGGEIGSGYCWGKYMLIFRKMNVKSKNVVARIYIREDGNTLRLFFSNVTKHAAFISAAPEYIRNVFTGSYGNCKHCKGDHCKFRKVYEIDGVQYEKCNGTTFEFKAPRPENIPDYLALFQEFYSVKNRIRINGK